MHQSVALWSDGCDNVCCADRRDAPASTSGRECDTEAGQHDKWLVFEVADTGCGVAKDGLCSLFKEFVQASPLIVEQSHIIKKSNKQCIAPLMRANLTIPSPGRPSLDVGDCLAL